MSQLHEYLEKHPSETQRMLGIDHDQLIALITNAEICMLATKNIKKPRQPESLNQAAVAPLN